MINDIISDSLTRIRNAGMRKLETTKLLHSKVVEALVEFSKLKGILKVLMLSKKIKEIYQCSFKIR